MVRGPFFDKNGVKRGAWSAEEDERLRSYIQTYGHPNWRQLPKFAGLARCGKSCRLRWLNYLRPNLRHGNFTQEEEEIIIKLHEQLGNKWSLIAEKLPGRTDNDVKNLWHSQLKKRSKQKERINNDIQHSEANIMDVAAESHVVLESSLVTSTEMLFPADQDNSASLESNDIDCSPMNWSREQDSVASWENKFQEYLMGSDFWTQPFVSENEYSEDYYYPIPTRGDSFSYDGTDLLYQVMQELPKY